MPSNAWQTLGRGNILGHLRADLKRASSAVYIVGPWIDAYFAEMVRDALPAGTGLRVVARPPEGASASFAEHAIAARTCLEGRPNTVVRLLANLHAKVVTIDEDIVYCGSANWYRYSLEESREIVLRGPLAAASGLWDELQVIWDQATAEPPLKRPRAQSLSVSKGYTKEVIDPVAAAKLKEVPGSFVLSRPRRRR